VCLINVIASESLGSDYLIKDEKLTPLLIQLLKVEKGDSNLRQNALGALQKFSLHRIPQTMMIENGMIEWIVSILKNVISVSTV
jgi:ribosomal protein L11